MKPAIAELSTPIPYVVDNTLVFGNQSVGLVAIYPSLNQERWVLPIPHGVMSELLVDKGNIYFGGGDGFIYSVSLDNGRVNWRYEIRNPIVSRPTVNGGRLFVTTSDDTVFAFDAGPASGSGIIAAELRLRLRFLARPNLWWMAMKCSRA